MYRRNIGPQLAAALTDTPVVLLGGARQTGKTTLVQAELAGRSPANYTTLDDLEALSAAASDPAGFLSALTQSGEPVILDEVQRAPLLFPAIKASVDRDRRPGRFLLTGSANVLLLPKISENLAGRIEILTLWPLAQAEIEGTETSFVDRLFDGDSPLVHFGGMAAVNREEILRRVVQGSYPEPYARTAERRSNWYASYLTTILQREVRDIANIDGVMQLPRLLAVLAGRSAALLNHSDISRTTGIAHSTLSRYMTLLEATYLVRTIPAWSGNLTLRYVKSPKVILNDTGMASHLLGISESRIREEPQYLGSLLENFVAMEIIKDIGWSTSQPTLCHWHTANREEIDLLLETRDGRLVGLEVKASSTVTSGDFKGLRTLSSAIPDRFVQGIVLYTGERVVPFGERLFAVPIGAIWHAK